MLKNLYKRRAGDRYDGWRVRDIDPAMSIVPFIMRTRIDSQCYFDATIDLEPMEKFIRAHKEDMPGLSIMNIVIAAMVRAVSQRPYVNRFVVYNKLYAHNDIRICTMVRRSMGTRGNEIPILPVFSPFDTLPDVMQRINQEIYNTRETDEKNASDKAAGLGKLPPWLFRLIVKIFYALDAIGLLPKGIHTASPYHCSAFLTNMGSLGIGPVYHHLYEFGTLSFFSAMGKKERIETIDVFGNHKVKRVMGFRCVIDERICDGHYWAVTIRYLIKLLAKPEVLMAPPARVVLDDGIRHKLWHDPNEGREAAGETEAEDDEE